MTDSKEKEKVLLNIRSCLISTKGRLTLKQLDADYRNIMGERIPYQKLGHKTLESFIQSTPSLLVSRCSKTNELQIDAKVANESSHISTMVRQQRSGKPKKKFVRPPSHRSFLPPPTTPQWRPKQKPHLLDKQKRRFENQNNTKLSAVSHQQFVSGGGYKKPKIPSKIVVVQQNEKINKEVGAVRKDNEKTKESEDILRNTMKRITRLMEECNRKENSSNISPIVDIVPSYEVPPEFEKTDDPVSDIRTFAIYHKLGNVDTKFTETKVKRSNKVQYHCKISVGPHKYSSYPADFFEKGKAEQHASQKALDDLMLKYSRRRSLLISSNDDIIERIPPMLEKHNTAVWMWQIEADYIDKYNEQLPSDWLQVINNIEFVSIEKYLGRYVLKHCNSNDILQKGKTVDLNLNLEDVSVSCNSVHFGENGRIYSIITVAHSPNEVWCQQYATQEYETFLDLLKRIEAFYSKNKEKLIAKNIHPGSYYIAYYEDTWYRVRAIEMTDNNQVECFSIDCGTELSIPKTDIFVMILDFAKIQAQAFVCRLAGLEEFNEVAVESPTLNGLIGCEVILELVVEEGMIEDIRIPVVMYEPVNSASINEQLIISLSIEAASVQLNKDGITEVYVSNIESNGDIYIQIRSFGFYRCFDYLNELNTTLGGISPRSLAQRSQDRYLIRTKNGFQRCSIIEWSPLSPNLAQIFFFDIGNSCVIDVTNEWLVPLEEIDNIVHKYPPQAIKVRFMIDQIPVDFLKKAEKLLEKDSPILVKIVRYDNESVPWVEFYKRTKDGELIFINKCISVDEELKTHVNSSNTSQLTRKRLINLIQSSNNELIKSVPSGGFLKRPELPALGDYFNVIVPFSVNPWNFCVQPLESYGRLQALMADMQEYYKDTTCSPLFVDDIVTGKIYASKHDDGLWYRTSVLKVINAGSISVFYCDFGYYTNLSVAQLVNLNDSFMDFPYQAMKARISGIKPIKKKWTMEDCDLFNYLVIKKEFVSILIGIEKDEFCKSDSVLQLLLIDTSGKDDINIKQVLIDKGIAISV